jgi:cysteinyl-tRNA synthetase
LGAVTVRKEGRSTVFPAGSELSIAELVAAASAPAFGSGATVAQSPTATSVGVPTEAATPRPLREEVASLERTVESSLEECDAPAAVRAILALEETIQAWSRDTDQSDALAVARSALRGAIVCLGELAAEGSHDPVALVGPFVDALLAERLRARASSDWAAADAIRERLVAAGVELHDTPDGTTWELRPRETPIN